MFAFTLEDHSVARRSCGVTYHGTLFGSHLQDAELSPASGPTAEEFSKCRPDPPQQLLNAD